MRSLAEVTRDLAIGGFPPACEAPGHADHPADVIIDRGWRCVEAARWGDDVKIVDATTPSASLRPEPGNAGVDVQAPGFLSLGSGPTFAVEFHQGRASITRSETVIRSEQVAS